MRPVAKWNYRNTNYVLLGFLIRRVTGMFYAGLSRQAHLQAAGYDLHTDSSAKADVIPDRAAGIKMAGRRPSRIKTGSRRPSTPPPTARSTSTFRTWRNGMPPCYTTQLLTRIELERDVDTSISLTTESRNGGRLWFCVGDQRRKTAIASSNTAAPGKASPSRSHAIPTTR